MTVTNADITASLAATAARAENWRKLTELYHLAPDASVEALEDAIKHEGFAHAVLSIMGALGDIAKAEKVATGNGKRGVVH